MHLRFWPPDYQGGMRLKALLHTGTQPIDPSTGSPVHRIRSFASNQPTSRYYDAFSAEIVYRFIIFQLWDELWDERHFLQESLKDTYVTMHPLGFVQVEQIRIDFADAVGKDTLSTPLSIFYFNSCFKGVEMQGNWILDHDEAAAPVEWNRGGGQTFFPLVFFTPHAGWFQCPRWRFDFVYLAIKSIITNILSFFFGRKEREEITFWMLNVQIRNKTLREWQMNIKNCSKILCTILEIIKRNDSRNCLVPIIEEMEVIV